MVEEVILYYSVNNQEIVGERERVVQPATKVHGQNWIWNIDLKPLDH